MHMTISHPMYDVAWKRGRRKQSEKQIRWVEWVINESVASINYMEECRSGFRAL